MNLPDFKEIIQKLSIFKSNLSLLASVILLIVAIGLFVPTQLISSSLRKQIQQESINKANRVKSKSVEPISAEQWKEEQRYQQAYANDSNQIELWAKASTRRELLSYEIFPKPKSTSILVFEKFGKRFRAGIDELIAGINARECPTDAEIDQSLKSVTVRSPSGARGRALLPSSTRTGRASRRSYRMSGEIEKKIIDGVCRERAKSANVYGSPFDLSGYDFWSQYKYDAGVEQAVKDCWYWQLGYWAIEDLIATIEKMNSGSNSVFTSPVKRLQRVSFDIGQRMVRSRRPGETKKTSEDDKPSYIRSLRDSLTVPYTGRYCDDDIDVIHFNIVVVVSADSVFSFMKELCSAKEHKFLGFSGQEPEQTFKHNQLTILESSINPVDRGSVVHELYRYGEDAVVELDLICEYIFIKSGYEEVKPESIKEYLKEEQETSGRKR